MRVLTVNVGSSSVKLSIVEDGRQLQYELDSLEEACREAEAAGVDAVAHRFVHGGPSIRAATVIDDAVVTELSRLTSLAPLHQPPALAALHTARALLPSLPHVACPDTAFHRTLPDAAATYAVPKRWREDWGVRRYGFHGLSHRYSARRAADMVPDGRRVVVAHLGAGASLCAVLDRKSIDTTMGFTPLEGLVMATRSGTVDPGLVPWLTTAHGVAANEIYESLVHESGLLGLAGSADMRTVLAADTPEAALAVDVYLHRLRGSIATMVAALGGLDVLAFTGGVGENSPVIRARAVEGLAWLGLHVDADANTRTLGTDADITDGAQPGRVLVIHAREDVEMADEAEQVLRPG
jgi:acetate kinase